MYLIGETLVKSKNKSGQVLGKTPSLRLISVPVCTQRLSLPKDVMIRALRRSALPRKRSDSWALPSCKRIRCFSAVRSLRSDVEAESEAKTQLSAVPEPLTGRALASLGALRGIRADRATGEVHIEVDMMVPGHPMLAAIQASCETSLRELPWVKTVGFTDLSLPAIPRGVNTTQPALANVQHCIAVSSCKGGVGKTTVAVNLAVSLALRGLRVGLLDADVYGPSVPLLVPAEDNVVRRSPNRANAVLPITAKGLPNLTMLSFGHVSPQSGAPGSGGTEAAVMRGPIASRVINQLVAGTEWGALDYLVVDMPPGTGDIQITLTQAIAFSGAVVVTTPHALSAADAAKGVAAFDQLQVPVLAMVENMAYFDGDDAKRYYPFGQGARDTLLNALQVLHGDGTTPDENSRAETRLAQTKFRRREKLQKHIELSPWHQMPLSAVISAGAELWSGPGHDGSPSSSSAEVATPAPVAMRLPDSEAARAYGALAESVTGQIFRNQLKAELVPSLTYIEGQGILLRYFSATSVKEYSVPIWELRSRDPATGVRTQSESSESDTAALTAKYADVGLSTFDMKGNYGVSFVWSDGYYMDIFPFEVLRQIAEETTKAKN